MKTKDGNKTYDTLQVHTNGYWHEFEGGDGSKTSGASHKKTGNTKAKRRKAKIIIKTTATTNTLARSLFNRLSVRPIN